jgi:hypothetical protein
MNTLLSLDSVLRSDTGELILNGIPVYRAFKSIGRVTLLSSTDREMTEAWCLIHKLNNYDDLIDNTVVIDPDEPLKFRQLSVARTKGSVDLYVDGDPGAVAEAMRRGIPAMLFSSPKYVRPEFRPDAPKAVRPWDELMAERTRQQAMFAVDERVTKPDELANFE